jgi:hypothetical protein
MLKSGKHWQTSFTQQGVMNMKTQPGAQGDSSSPMQAIGPPELLLAIALDTAIALLDMAVDETDVELTADDALTVLDELDELDELDPPVDDVPPPVFEAEIDAGEPPEPTVRPPPAAPLPSDVSSPGSSAVAQLQPTTVRTTPSASQAGVCRSDARSIALTSARRTMRAG